MRSSHGERRPLPLTTRAALSSLTTLVHRSATVGSPLPRVQESAGGPQPATPLRSPAYPQNVGRRLIVAAWFFGHGTRGLRRAHIYLLSPLVINEGSGIGGNGLHGPVETFANRNAPWGMIAGITASVVAGLNRRQAQGPPVDWFGAYGPTWLKTVVACKT